MHGWSEGGCGVRCGREEGGQGQMRGLTRRHVRAEHTTAFKAEVQGCVGVVTDGNSVAHKL